MQLTVRYTLPQISAHVHSLLGGLRYARWPMRGLRDFDPGAGGRARRAHDTSSSVLNRGTNIVLVVHRQ